MKKNQNELCKNLVCFWDEGCQKLFWTNYVLPESGIYHIRVGNDSYIGRAANLKVRINNHINAIFHNGNSGCWKIRKKFEEVKQFSVYVICETNKEDLDEVEKYYIQTYAPTLNTLLSPNKEDFKPITAYISENNIKRLDFIKIFGMNGIEFSSRGEIISSILDLYFEENGDPLEYTS